MDQTDIDPAVSVTPPKGLVYYSLLFVIIDGSLQAEVQKVDARIGSDRTRVYLRCAVPTLGLELDGRNAIGREFQVVVFGPGGEPIVGRDMTLRHFAISHEAGHAACARYVFEAPARTVT